MKEEKTEVTEHDIYCWIKIIVWRTSFLISSRAIFSAASLNRLTSSSTNLHHTDQYNLKKQDKSM